jgi:hypothetical protein
MGSLPGIPHNMLYVRPIWLASVSRSRLPQRDRHAQSRKVPVPKAISSSQSRSGTSSLHHNGLPCILANRNCRNPWCLESCSGLENSRPDLVLRQPDQLRRNLDLALNAVCQTSGSRNGVIHAGRIVTCSSPAPLRWYGVLLDHAALPHLAANQRGAPSIVRCTIDAGSRWKASLEERRS